MSVCPTPEKTKFRSERAAKAGLRSDQASPRPDEGIPVWRALAYRSREPLAPHDPEDEEDQEKPMSERPNFAEVLLTHQRIPLFDGTQGQRCVGCDNLRGETDGPNSPRHVAHLAAVLNAEVDRWLGDEGTRERVAEAGSEALVCKRTCPDDCDGSRCKAFRRLLASGVWLAAQPALAALATPAVPTAEEER